MFGYNKPQLMAIVFCHKERGISVEEENHLVTVGIVKKSKTILVLLASPIQMQYQMLQVRQIRSNHSPAIPIRELKY